MKVTKKDAGDGTVELTIEVPHDKVLPHLERVANDLSKDKSIPGFRPGKAPLKTVMAQLGPMPVYQAALERIVMHSFADAVTQEKLMTVGQPEIKVEKVAPDNPVIYTATVALMPDVTLKKWDDIKLEKKDVTVSDEEVDKVVDELRNMQATEKLVMRPAKKGDKVEVNFEVKREGAVIEGGTGTKYPLVLGTGSMIPGFEEQIIGLTAGEKKDFTLKFPSPYANEQLAGKEAQFHVELIQVYERVLPEKNDEWSKKVLNKPYADLVSQLRENIKNDKAEKESQRQEGEFMEKLIERTTFSAVPEIMIQSEVAKMFSELQHDVQQRGMEWDKYLQSLKKTEEELKKEFRSHAERRAKSALILRALSEELGITVSDQEIQAELDKQRDMYKDNQEAVQNIDTPEFKRYVSNVLRNRKVITTALSKLKQ